MSDRPWFIRVRTPLSYRLEPYSPAGWAATVIFVLGAAALAMVHVHRTLTRGAWVVWGIVFAAWVVGYLVLAFRNSEAATVVLPDKKGRQKGS